MLEPRPSSHFRGPTPNVAETRHPIVQELLKSRGLTGHELEEFFSEDLKKLPDFSQLRDIEVASARLAEAIENNQQVGIYGDYDVDGTTSCALFFHFFDLLGQKIQCIQPSRFVEGYGLHVPSVDKAIEKGIELLITVDCGITNCEAADHARERGLDLIITDHHKDAREEMPNALAVVNPNRRDEPQGHMDSLAGVGVAFAVCVETRKRLLEKGREVPSLYPLLQFVAIGTICDLVPLNPMNLKLVRHGLKQLLQSKYAGIRTFFTPEERQRARVPSEKLSFLIGPMINSKGRLDHPEKALELLISPTHETAFPCFSHLENSNRERKIIQAQVAREAFEAVESDAPINIVYGPEWHEGVIGIVASKLVESYKVPAIVFTNAEEEGVIKASARTAGEELNIFELLKSCEDLFIKFGGHKAAAGLSMPLKNLEEFKQRVHAYLGAIPTAERTLLDSFDMEISFRDISPKLVKALDELEPFGRGNDRPLFRMKDFQIQSFTLMKDVHVRWEIAPRESRGPNLRGVSFNYIGRPNCHHPEELQALQFNTPLEIDFHLGINHFRGCEYLQLMVQRIAPTQN